MKTILTTLLLTICIMVVGQNTTKQSDLKYRYLIGQVIDDGSYYQHKIYDTVPVVMLVSDTTPNKKSSLFIFQEQDSARTEGRYFGFPDYKEVGRLDISVPMHHQPYVIFGYQVTERYYTGEQVNTLRWTGESKTTYLNHLKHPLPTRLMVWMAVRRK